jgi:hypothetical protein
LLRRSGIDRVHQYNACQGREVTRCDGLGDQSAHRKPDERGRTGFGKTIHYLFGLLYKVT